MSKKRKSRRQKTAETGNPRYALRDKLFVEACAKCARANRCTFRTSIEGPEAVCWQLIQGGTYSCESCVRYNNGGGCHFKCVFFRPS